MQKAVLRELKLVLRPAEKAPVKPWLRNKEVCNLLGISLSTLKRMWIKGGLKATKIGGIHYYALRDIDRLLAGEPNKLR